jgi:hypothetical protein
MRSVVKYSNVIGTRCQPEIVKQVDQAAAASLMRRTDPSGECAKKRYH